jgi:hypothetical protein
MIMHRVCLHAFKQLLMQMAMLRHIKHTKDTILRPIACIDLLACCSSRHSWLVDTANSLHQAVVDRLNRNDDMRLLQVQHVEDRDDRQVDRKESVGCKRRAVHQEQVESMDSFESAVAHIVPCSVVVEHKLEHRCMHSLYSVSLESLIYRCRLCCIITRWWCSFPSMLCELIGCENRWWSFFAHCRR